MATAAPAAADNALPGLGRRRILLIIGALMLGMLLADDEQNAAASESRHGVVGGRGSG